MFRYVLRRIAAIVPILFGVSVVCFSFIHLAPGDAITALAGDNASPAVLEKMRQAYGYDQPLPIQYLRWLGMVLTGNLGTSIMTGRSVLSEIVPAARAHRDTCPRRYRHEPFRRHIDGNDRCVYTPHVAGSPGHRDSSARRVGSALLGRNRDGRDFLSDARASAGDGNGAGHIARGVWLERCQIHHPARADVSS